LYPCGTAAPSREVPAADHVFSSNILKTISTVSGEIWGGTSISADAPGPKPAGCGKLTALDNFSLGVFGEPAQCVDQLHLLNRIAAGLKKAE
jgi:hypothetical protein